MSRVRLLRLALRFFWGLRLHLVCTLQGLPLGLALTGAKANEREILEAILASTPTLPRPGRQVDIADKAYYGVYYGRAFEARLDDAGIELLRKARNGEQPRTGEQSSSVCRGASAAVLEQYAPGNPLSGRV